MLTGEAVIFLSNFAGITPKDQGEMEPAELAQAYKDAVSLYKKMNPPPK